MLSVDNSFHKLFRTFNLNILYLMESFFFSACLVSLLLEDLQRLDSLDHFRCLCVSCLDRDRKLT
jgi:hypothetical protein